MKLRNARKSARHAKPFKPSLECLEDRKLMCFDLAQAGAVAFSQDFTESPTHETAPYVGNVVAGMDDPSLASSKLGAGTDNHVVVAGGLSGGVVGSAVSRSKGEEIPSVLGGLSGGVVGSAVGRSTEEWPPPPGSNVSIQGGLSGGVVGSAVDRAMHDVSLLGGLSGGVVGSALGRSKGEEIPSIQGGLSGGVVGSAVDRAMQDVSIFGGLSGGVVGSATGRPTDGVAIQGGLSGGVVGSAARG